MQDIREILKVFSSFNSKKVDTLIDKMSFKRIFLLWILVSLLFGIVYHTMSSDTSYLYHTIDGVRVNSLPNSIYFSFVTITTTGFGDLIPIGFFKILSIFEVITGLLLLAIVTSKLVSIKQDVILSEVYEISFSDRLQKIRSSMLLLRQNITRVARLFSLNTYTDEDILNVYNHINEFKETLFSIKAIVSRKDRYHFIRNIDRVDLELICNSIIGSFNRIDSFLRLVKMKSQILELIDFDVLGICYDSANLIFKTVSKSENIKGESMKAMLKRKEKVFVKFMEIYSFLKRHSESDQKKLEQF